MQRIASIAQQKARSSPLAGRGVVFWLLGGCMMLYLIGPLVYFFFALSWPSVPGALSDPDAIQALITSAISATIATLLMALFGVPLGYLLARFHFPGKSIVSIAIYLPLVFPPVVSGIVLLVLFGPYGLIGAPLANAGWEVDDTLAGIVLAQIFVAAPFVIVAARAAFESIDPQLERVAATLGHNRWSLFWRVSLPLARGGILAGLILAWMRALGEFGATVVLAYHPYTIPVYTFVQLSGSGVAGALPLALFSLSLSLLVIGAIVIVQRRTGKSVVVS
ncbi:MAG TPA: ABC transporter permease [Ktedonobacteraceae bacterium]|nr:ABC transporter permease [Ktedonobacteraceae bacterium]